MQRKEQASEIGRGWTSATMLTFSHLSCPIITSFRKADHPIRDSKEGQAELLLLATAAVDTYKCLNILSSDRLNHAMSLPTNNILKTKVKSALVLVPHPLSFFSHISCRKLLIQSLIYRHSGLYSSDNCFSQRLHSPSINLMELNE